VVVKKVKRLIIKSLSDPMKGYGTLFIYSEVGKDKILDLPIQNKNGWKKRMFFWL
jgi:hypothetical protein